MKKTLAIALIVTGFSLLPFLGGSMIWYLGGADNLDINGLASPVGRAPASITVGSGWSVYGGDVGGHRYSSASQISPDNVENLAPAWLYRTGDMASRPDLMGEAVTEGTPILVEDSLVFCTPFNEVIALDPGTGEQRWRFSPRIDLEQHPANAYVCRGVSHWRDATGTGHCASRIFMGTNDATVIAVDAIDGARRVDFGNNGEVRVKPGMELLWPGEFQITSPPVIVGDTLIVGSAISDNARVEAPAGSVRAFDVRR